MLWAELLILFLAIIACGFAVVGHRQAADAATRWGTRSSMLLCLGIIAGTAPAAFVPTIGWLRWAGMLLSLVFIGASFNLLRRQVRATVE